MVEASITEYGLDQEQLARLGKSDLAMIVLGLLQTIRQLRNKYYYWEFLIFSQDWRAKKRQEKIGNENGAQPYPAFIHRDTGEVIPAGVNLAKMCRERGLTRSGMVDIKNGKYRYHKGWRVYEQG